MEPDQLEDLLKRKETIRVELKTTPKLAPSEANQFEIASQLVSFANRKGGYLIFGVNDDGTYEGKRIDEDRETQKIANIARDRCSPVVNFTHQFVREEKGDVLVIEIERRKGIPHAVVYREGHEIRKRAYYIRTPKGKRLIDDFTLDWLFKNAEDATLTSEFRFFLTYNRKTRGLPALESPYAITKFLPFFNALNEADWKYLSEDESARMGSFLVEVAPYAMLSHLALAFWGRWEVEIFKAKGERIISPKKNGLEGKRINLADIRKPSSDLISKLSIDLNGILGKSVSEMMVPPDAEVLIELSEPQKQGHRSSSIKIRKSDVFSIEIQFSQSMWSLGLPYVSPLRKRFEGIDNTIEDLRKLEEQIASIGVHITFDAQFMFLDVDDPLFVHHYEYGKTILDLLNDDWNWDLFLSHLPDSMLYSIDAKLDEVLRRLKTSSLPNTHSIQTEDNNS